jgi:hypothetical protein
MSLNPRLKPGVADAVVRELPLRTGEGIVAVHATTCRKPKPLDVVVVTTQRVVGFWSPEMAVHQEVALESISSVSTFRPMANFAALVVRAHGVDHQFGVLGDECDDTVELIERLRTGAEVRENPPTTSARRRRGTSPGQRSSAGCRRARATRRSARPAGRVNALGW